MYQSILVPLDGSTFGEHALPLAASIARPAGCTLLLAHVHEPTSIYSDEAPYLSGELETHYREQTRSYLDGLVERLERVTPHPVASVLLEGQVVTAIREQVAKSQAGLVVMTTHGRGPVGRFWLGSVADKLLRQLSIPVLLVRPGQTAPDLNVEPPVKHILIPLDRSELAECMLTPATALGGLLDSQYTLLRVAKPVHPMLPYTEGLSVAQLAGEILDQIEKIQSELRKEAQHYLTGVAERLRARSVRVQTRLVVEEHPAAAILHEAAACGADLIAIETHGRGGLSRLILGSVADKVLRGSMLPVLVHHPNEKADSIPRS
jgi:nucleotide-binding universal stress UspA family protein